MPKIHLQTVIDAPRSLVFDLARDVDVHARTVPWTKERAVGAITSGKLGVGDVITFEAAHFGITQRLTARLTEFVFPEMFADVMLAGAFSSLTHTHRFLETAPGKTTMTDDLDFVSPLGPLGRLADALFLERYMRNFLTRRNENLKQIAEDSIAELGGE